MGQDDLIWIFWICAIVGGISAGFGFGNMFTSGVGWLVLCVWAICSLPTGIWFYNNVHKFLKD